MTVQLVTPKTYVLYHRECGDGLAAAWVAWRNLGATATYHAVDYQTELPSIEDGAIVYMLDFSAPAEVMTDLAKRCTYFCLLDHHEGMMDDVNTMLCDVSAFYRAVEDTPPVTVKFDIRESGATIAWKHWEGDEPAPAFINYVKDRDLWDFNLPQSRSVSYGTYKTVRGLTFEEQMAMLSTWAEWSQDYFVEIMTARGAWDEQQMLKRVETALQFVEHAIIGGYRVPIAYGDRNISEIAEALYRLYPKEPFVAVAQKLKGSDEGFFKWHLRSDKHNLDSVNVFVIAQQYGGNGHYNAAGFKVKADTIEILTE
jgi:oligoribonuclease NrnB/cAMP/cGMP phosphodiesterase (DHH superfamily)